MVFDRHIRRYQVWKIPGWNGTIVRDIVRLSVPIVGMSIVGLGSSFVFLGLVDNFGPQALAQANLVRISYLILAIPVWGFSSGTNTIISYFIGRGHQRAVLPLLWKTAFLCAGLTQVLALPLLLVPQAILYPLLGDANAQLVADTYPTFVVLFFILLTFSFGSIFSTASLEPGLLAPP
ncbi:MAG: hypothetical protein HC821_05030 [Lewinella sp.]|nr:hypothetical protein [Lewinella sp.]